MVPCGAGVYVCGCDMCIFPTESITASQVVLQARVHRHLAEQLTVRSGGTAAALHGGIVVLTRGQDGKARSVLNQVRGGGSNSSCMLNQVRSERGGQQVRDVDRLIERER
jgi:hypothetical protein